MQRVSFYVVNALYKKYSPVPHNQQVVKLEGNEYYILKEHKSIDKSIVLGQRINPGAVSLIYVENRYIAHIKIDK